MRIYSATIDSASGLIPIVMGVDDDETFEEKSVVAKAPHVIQVTGENNIRLKQMVNFGNERTVNISRRSIISWCESTPNLQSAFMDIYAEIVSLGSEDFPDETVGVVN